MTVSQVAVAAGGLALVGLALFGGSEAGAGPPDATEGGRTAVRRALGWGALPALAAGAAWLWLEAWVIAGSVGLVAGLCVSAWRLTGEVKAAAEMAESVSSLATVLANQATAATTVVDAVANAAPVVSGPVRAAARQLAADCQLIGVGAATARFKRSLDAPSAEWLGDIVDISASGGGRWLDVAHIFETEAGQEAEVLRYLYRRVGSQLPTLVAVMVLSVGIVVGLGMLSSEVGTWLLGQQGQAAVAVAVGATALAVGRTLSSIRVTLR